MLVISMTYYLIELEHCDGDYKITIYNDMDHIKKYVKREELNKDDYTVIHGTLQHHDKTLYARGPIDDA